MDIKVHVTAILCITADATKFPPMLVFKGQPEGRVENNKKHPQVQSQKIFAYCQRKDWNNETIMKRWISDIWENILIWI